MTDDSQNLTPAKPIVPRSKLPTNPRMAQPIRSSEPVTRPPIEVSESEEPALGPETTTAPPAEAFTPVQLVVEEVVEAPPRVEPDRAPPRARTQLKAQTQVTETAPAIVPTPAPVPTPDSAPPGVPQELGFPKTIRDTLRRVDQAWLTFRGAASRFPSERMDERLSEDGWTRKQMLEHIAAWHDLTADRLVKMFSTGKPVLLEHDTDAFNAAVARRAVGKTSGEVLKDMDATFNRLRRQLARATDGQLKADDWWLAFVIGGNTYGHYEEHWAEIYTPELPVNARQRR